jgi:hypothetical protein
MNGARAAAMLLAAWLAALTGVMAQKATPAPSKPASRVATMMFDELDRLIALPVLTPENVAQVTGVAWTPGAETRSMAYRMLGGTGAAGRLVKTADLRVPLQGSDARGEILVLDLAPGSGLTLADVVARVGRTNDIEIPLAAAPPTDPVYYRHRVGAALVSFGIARSKAHEVVSIVIDRTPPG